MEGRGLVSLCGWWRVVGVGLEERARSGPSGLRCERRALDRKLGGGARLAWNAVLNVPKASLSGRVSVVDAQGQRVRRPEGVFSQAPAGAVQAVHGFRGPPVRAHVSAPTPLPVVAAPPPHP